MKFIESIRLEEGTIFHLELHQRRTDLTTLAHFGRKIRHNLSAALSLQSLPASGLYKIRITYDVQIRAIEIDPYARRAIRTIELVEAPNLDYRYKYADRSNLTELKGGLPDGVEPIVVQNGMLADGLYANVCVHDGERWLTPDRPLLMGVARSIALARGEIAPAKITSKDVRAGRYRKLKLINCMSAFPEAPVVDLL